MDSNEWGNDILAMTYPLELDHVLIVEYDIVAYNGLHWCQHQHFCP